MPTTLAQGLERNFEHALALLEAALEDCPEELWETDLWPDAPTGPTPHGGLHGSAPWFLGYHALTVLDYDLTAEQHTWSPPPPIDDNTYASPNRAFTKDELLGYLGHCRGRVREALDQLTDDRAAEPVPALHRYAGTLYGVLVASLPLHLVEHAAQIRQFVTTAGGTVRPMPGDWGYGKT